MICLQGPPKIKWTKSDQASIITRTSLRELVERPVSVEAWKQAARSWQPLPQGVLQLIDENSGLSLSEQLAECEPESLRRLASIVLQADDSCWNFQLSSQQLISLIGQLQAEQSMSDSQLISKLKPALLVGISSKQALQDILSEMDYEAPGLWRIRQGEADIIISWRPSSGGLRELLVWGGEARALEISAGCSHKLLEFESRAAMASWAEKEMAKASDISARPAGQSVHLSPLGGLGELHSWQASFGGCQQAAEAEESLSSQPASDWMPVAAGALCREIRNWDLPPVPAELRSTIQLYRIGSIVHSGFRPLQHRLGYEMKPVQLYCPANPYLPPPIPMSRAVQCK